MYFGSNDAEPLLLVDDHVPSLSEVKL